MVGRVRVDITGQKFNRWTVLGYEGGGVWQCKCECGTVRAIIGANQITKGWTKSCGCLARERASEANTGENSHRWKGGVSKDKEYQALRARWGSMIDRCQNSNNQVYRHYGGRGISVCRRWQVFENFVEDMGYPPFAKAELDRIDNDGDYCPENVRWATRSQQMSNKRPMSEEARARISLAMKGKPKSLEHRLAMSQGQKKLWRRRKRPRLGV